METKAHHTSGDSAGWDEEHVFIITCMKVSIRQQPFNVGGSPKLHKMILKKDRSS